MSVVIPLYNEARGVLQLLNALDRQVVRPGQVVCVDAGSTDGTGELVREFKASLPICLLRKGRMNPGEARNTGVEAAAYPWIAFADGGTEPSPYWLLRLVEKVEEGADVVFGSYEPLCDSFFRSSAALAYVPPRGSAGIRGPFIASTAISREAFESLGGFPPYRASEDLIFIEDVYGCGLRVAYAPDAVVTWETAPGFASTFRRFALYSMVNLEVGRGRHWHRRLAWQTTGVVVAAVLAALSGLGLWSLTLIAGWYLARSTRQAWKKHGQLPFWVWRPDRLIAAAGVLIVVDLATWVGAFRWLSRSDVGER